MRLSLHRNRLRSFTMLFVSRFLAVLILSSFALTQLPIVNSSAEEMPCCAGKSSEHCDSGLAKPPPRPVITEPMCGLAQTPPVSAETTSHHHADAESNTSQLTAESLSQPCRMDCGACVAGISRHERDKSIFHSRISQASPATTSARYNSRAIVYSSNENWTRINPRGPPAVL
jgi:hypothetical protein